MQKPELRKRKLILFRRDSRRGQRVVAISPLAQLDGVRIDMSLSEAKSLLRKSLPVDSPVSQPLPPQQTSSFQPRTKSHPREQHRELAKKGIVTTASQKTRGGGRKRVSENSDRPLNADSKPAPRFYILEHDPVGDREALEAVVDSLHPFSPIVGIEQVESPESCFLDTTGLESIFGSEAELMNRATRFLSQQGYFVFAATAQTLGLAWALARYRPVVRATPVVPVATVSPEPIDNERVEESGSLSDESALLKPSPPQLQRQPNQVPRHPPALPQLSPLPIGALRLNELTVETLRQLGIEYVEQLLKIPRFDLTSRFGDEIHRRIDQAIGKIDEPIVARHLPAEFSAEQLLDFPTCHRATIEVVLSRLIEKICQQMRSTQKGALEWTFVLHCQDSPSIEFRVNLFQPTATMEHVMQLVEMQLETELRPHWRSGKPKSRKTSQQEKVLQKKAEPAMEGTAGSEGSTDSLSYVPTEKLHSHTSILIQEIEVRVTSCVLLVQRQRKLFDENPRLDKQALSHLINRLTSRLGQQSVVYPTLQSGAQPEFSFRFKPLVDPQCLRTRLRKERVAKVGSHALARPLRLVTPVKLDKAVLNGRREGPPTSNSRSPMSEFEFIVQCWGPERIETGWWRGPTTRRDYWRVETECGQHLWVFYDLRTRCWFLHGEF